MIDTAPTSANASSSATQAQRPARSTEPTRRPSWDVRDGDLDLVLTADMPGVPTEGIEITVTDDLLTVRGRRTSERPDGYQARHQEYRHADYASTLSLPSEIDTAAITASIKHGVLRLVLPKVKTATPRRIAVSNG